ncbi:hypothetical protein RSX31_17255 [Rossellomorea sp. YC4-1]|nr:hypothetical protein [Rossellomorea sp. YC4-1]
MAEKKRHSSIGTASISSTICFKENKKQASMKILACFSNRREVPISYIYALRTKKFDMTFQLFIIVVDF